MPVLNPSDAPPGYIAVQETPEHDFACVECAFKSSSDECKAANPCGKRHRADKCDVFYRKKAGELPGFLYRQLLMKYIAHVGTCEGVDFIDPDDSCPVFTPEEWAELRKLSKEANEMKPSGT